MDKEKDPKRQYYEDLAKQIEREDNLVNTRMTWMLTLQGFLFAALALITKQEGTNNGLYNLLKGLLPATGITLSALGSFGILGANLALRKLKDNWKDIEKEGFIQPFGDNRASFFGNLPSTFLPIVLLLVWLVILVYG